MPGKAEIEIDELIRLKTDSEKLKIILDLIFNNTRLSYKNKLKIDEDEELMTYLSIVESTLYKRKQNNLVKEKIKEDEE